MGSENKIAVWPQRASGPTPEALKVNREAARQIGVRAGETVTPWQLGRIEEISQIMGDADNGTKKQKESELDGDVQ